MCLFLLNSYGVIPWASYQIRKIAGCACAGNAGNVFPDTEFRRKPLVSDPGMHHGTCVAHVPWCMLGSLTGGGGENVPGIPGACATRNFTYLARGPYLIWGDAGHHLTVFFIWTVIWYNDITLQVMITGCGLGLIFTKFIFCFQLC